MPSVEDTKKIHFYFLKKCNSLKNRTILKAFLLKLLKKEGVKFKSLNYIFCSDAYLLDINKRFLNHDYYTDILTFVFSKANDPVDGEIYISLDRVKENSKTYKSSFTYELHRVVFHGVLHLSGYSDNGHKNAAIMRNMEEKYLSLYNHVSRET